MEPNGDRRSTYSQIPTESLPKKPPIARKPSGLGQTAPGHESFAKIRATFDQMPTESLPYKPVAKTRTGFTEIAPDHESFVKIRDAFNQKPEEFLTRKPPVAKKRAGVNRLAPARPPSFPSYDIPPAPARPPSFPSYDFPPPLPPSPPPFPEGGCDLDDTYYYDPWSPDFPVQLPVRTPTEAELKAAGRHPFSFSPQKAEDSPMFPPRYKYDFGQGFTNPGRVRSEPNFEYHLDTPSPLLRPPPPVPPRRLPPVPAPRTKFLPRDTENEPADFLEGTNPFAKPGPQDPYVGSSVVVGLTAKTFKKFIKDVDAAFVLFYDPGDEDGSWAKTGVKKAAQNTRKENHVYAAVDCTKERELCRKQNVMSVPTLKLFVKGMTVDTYDSLPLLPAQIRQVVENAPIVGGDVGSRNRCHVQ